MAARRERLRQVRRVPNGRPYKGQRCKYMRADTDANVSSPKDVPLTAHGNIVSRIIGDIPKHYPAISVDQYVIMPNHIHLLLQIHTDHDGRPMAAPTVSTVVNQMKGAASKQMGFSVWQKGFYDHVIRSNADYLEVMEIY